MRTITLEEHFISPGFLAGPGKEFTERLRNSGPHGARICELLQEVGDKRVAEMDAAGIDVQVLSLNSPGVEQAEVAEQISISRESNDFLAETVKKHPTRFAGLASLPIAAPDKAAEELERPGSSTGLQGNAHQRPHARPLSGRQVLLADPGARRRAECPDLSPPDHPAEGGGRGVVRRFCSRRDRRCSQVQVGAGTSRPPCISFA